MYYLSITINEFLNQNEPMKDDDGNRKLKENFKTICINNGLIKVAKCQKYKTCCSTMVADPEV